MRLQLISSCGLLALLATACSTGTAAEVTEPSPPVRTIAQGSPSPSPTHPPAAAVDWSFEVTPEGSERSLGVRLLSAGDRFVATTGYRLIGITGKGEKAWQRSFDREVSTSVADDMLIVTHRKGGTSSWPPPYVVLGVDPATGKTLWKTTSSPYHEVVGGMVYTPVCRSKQTERQDDCMLSARDPRTGVARWTVPAEHVATVTGEQGGVLTMTTRPKGYRGKHWLMTLDAATGRRLGVRIEKEQYGGELLYPAGQDRVSGPAFLASGTLVISSKREQVRTFKEKCRLDMLALNAKTGKRAWKAGIRLADPQASECAYGLPIVSADGRSVFGVDERGHPLAFDLVKGRPGWTGGKPGTILNGDAETVLVREDRTLTLYDLSSGEARWSDEEALKTWREVRTRLAGDKLLVYPSECSRDTCYVRVYDLADGPLGSAPAGTYAASGDGWVATSTTKDKTTTFRLIR